MKVTADVHYESLYKHQEELCGDRVVVSYTDNSTVVVLADGLGSGVKANILATLTSTILSTLLVEGCELAEAIDTVSATLPTCQIRQVAYSTFTAFQLFDHGEAILVEFDNPKTIILRNQRECLVDRRVREIRGRKIVESRFHVCVGDQIVMISDGILHAGLGTILNFGFERKDIVNHILATSKPRDRAKDTARNLLFVVNDLYQNQPMDDSTVCVVHVLKRTKSVVMVGPPSEQEMDKEIVYQLLGASGKKIVCGGTTAQIVSRITQTPIEMSGELHFNNDLPPTAFIRGIDLVSEGVLTLGRVKDLLSEVVKDEIKKEVLLESKATDGATRMIKLLLQECSEIHFIVGLADNPAHSQVAYSPLSLSMKRRLIEQIAEYLRFCGKIVHLSAY